MQQIKSCTRSCRKWLNYLSMHMYSNTKALTGQHNPFVIFMENAGGRGKSFSWTLTYKEGDKNQWDLESCSWCLAAPIHFIPMSQVLNFITDFESQTYFKYMHWGKKWNSTGDILCLGLQEQRPLVSKFYIQASRNLVLIFFFCLTCIAKMLKIDPLWQIINSLLIKWETLYRAVLPISVGFHTDLRQALFPKTVFYWVNKNK